MNHHTSHLQPDGTTFPPGVYTKVQWRLGDLTADEEVALPYAAGDRPLGL